MAKSAKWKYLETILKTLLQGLQGRQEVDPGLFCTNSMPESQLYSSSGVFANFASKKFAISRLNQLISELIPNRMSRTLIQDKNLILFMEYSIIRIILISIHKNFTSIVRKLHKSYVALKNLPTLQKNCHRELVA